MLSSHRLYKVIASPFDPVTWSSRLSLRFLTMVNESSECSVYSFTVAENGNWFGDQHKQIHIDFELD